MSDSHVAMFTRVLCLVFVIGSYVVANYPTPILEMMSYSWGIISGAFLAPYAIALYWKGINRAGRMGRHVGRFPDGLCPGGDLRLYHAGRPDLCVFGP